MVRRIPALSFLISCGSALAACSGGTVVNNGGGYNYSPNEGGPGTGGQGGHAAGGSGNANDGATSTAGVDGSGTVGAPSDAGTGGNGSDGSPAFGGLSVGAACSSAPAEACRPGLACVTGHCAFSHQGTAGSSCVASDECASGLACILGSCAPSGTGAEGASCTTDAACQSGLRCGIVGFGASCVPEGSADVGQACAVSSDCVAGLLCAPSPGDGGAAACAPIPTTGPGAGISFGLPAAPGLKCDPAATGRVDAYFEVPGAQGTKAGGDFFRLPFPNDARINAGKIDLDGFPTPGATFLGYDPVKVYLDAVVANDSAWGSYPTVLFRFSGPLDFATLRATSTSSPVQFLDITDPKNPGNGGAEWTYSGGNGKYICHDWLGVRRPPGSPLEPGHVYTVYVASSARDANGLAINRSPELAALLASTAPSDPALASAYGAYKPLRDYLAAQNVAESSILTASVITVGPVRAKMASLAAAVKATPLPTASSWVKCDGAATSPCPDATGNRACGAPAAAYDEYHALVSIPIFQQGAAPYLDAGGDIAGAPVRNENVCVALTVPKGAAPSSGWPVAVFGHGTGGSFRDGVRPEVAGALATAPTPMAVLGFDEVEHGPRRGSSTASPNVLFFNFKNPSAAQGNPLQGGADVISIGRFAASLSVPASATGGAVITTNPNAIVYFGHSQGAMHGSVGLPYTNDYRAAVLSGNGASLAHALLTKTSPDNIASAVPFVLGGDFDGSGQLFGGEDHPVLTILDQWIGPADPLNFGRNIARSPNTAILPKSVFQTYGLGDTYSPPITLQMYALAAALPLAAHDATVAKPDAFGGLTEQPVPVSGNFATSGHTVTLAVREYQNAAGKDGHFVVFDVPSANADAVRFLSMAASGSVPQVGQ